MTLMDAERVTHSDLLSGLGARIEGGFTAMKLTGPFRRVVDPSWLADPVSIAVLNMALAVAVLWAGGVWEPLA
jgi:hypothetical protein